MENHIPSDPIVMPRPNRMTRGIMWLSVIALVVLVIIAIQVSGGVYYIYNNTNTFAAEPNGMMKMMNASGSTMIWMNNTNGEINAKRYSSDGQTGINVTITILKDANLLSLVKTFCNITYTNGIATGTTC